MLKHIAKVSHVTCIGLVLGANGLRQFFCD